MSPTSDANQLSSPAFEDITAAAKRLKGHAVETPLIRNSELDAYVGATVLIKPENLQRSGSFKFRGAFNRLNLIPVEDRKKGVVACSSGNHAQGIAMSAQLLGMSATIVMPSDAPVIKSARTRRLGAQVVTYDRDSEDREEIAAAICLETGATFVHPFNDPGVIAGQGTVGLELAAQAQSVGLDLDDVLVCTGGGGLASGVALALSHTAPSARFHTVEPDDFDDYRRPLQTGVIQKNNSRTGSICDAILTDAPGELGFSILKQLASEALTVSDKEVLAAVAFAFNELKLVVEPGGAAALAALLAGKLPVKGKVVGVVLTGGNIDAAMMKIALSGHS